jgi:hypothetical protein
MAKTKKEIIRSLRVGYFSAHTTNKFYVESLVKAFKEVSSSLSVGINEPVTLDEHLSKYEEFVVALHQGTTPITTDFQPRSNGKTSLVISGIDRTERYRQVRFDACSLTIDANTESFNPDLYVERLAAVTN